MPQPPAPILKAAPRADALDAAGTLHGGVPGLARLARGGDRHVFVRRLPGVPLVSDPSQATRAEPQSLAHRRRRPREAGVAIEAEVAWPQGGHPTRLRDPAGRSVEPAEAQIRG